MKTKIQIIPPAEKNPKTCGAIRTLVCNNLRLDPACGHLRAEGEPGILARTAARPVARYNGTQGADTTIYADGCRLLWQPDRPAGTAPAEFAVLKAEPTAVLLTGEKEMTVATSEGLYRIEFSDTGVPKCSNCAGSYPAVWFEEYSEQTLTQDLGEARLSGDYSSYTGALNATDTARLTTDVLTAYTALSDKARAGGLWMQPVMMRWRLADADGKTLLTGAPVLVGPKEGAGGCTEFHATLADGSGSRQATQISAAVYRLRVQTAVATTADAARCRKLIVEATLPLHPIDPSAQCPTRISRSSDGSKTTLSFRLPGSSAGMADAPALRSSLVKGLIPNVEELYRTVTEIDNPFSSSKTVELRAEDFPTADPAEACRTMAAAAVRRPDKVSRAEVLCSAPHIFGAMTGAVSSDTVMWGGIRPFRFDGFCPQTCFRDFTGDGTWYATATVSFADGKSVTVAENISAGKPERVRPVLWYPAPDAVALTLCMVADGRATQAEFPLTATADGRGAAWVAEGAKPVVWYDVAADTASAPSATLPFSLAVSPMPGAVATARLGQPEAATGLRTVTAGSIVALHPAPTGDSAFGYAYRRFLIFCSAETLMATTSADGGLRSVDYFDYRALASADHVTPTTDSQSPLMAVLGGDLTAIGRRRCVTLISGFGAHSLGWDAGSSRLWATGTSGSIKVLSANATALHTLNMKLTRPMLTTPDGLLACGSDDSGDCVYFTGLPGKPTDVDIVCRAVCEAPTEARTGRPMRVCCATVSLQTNNFCGSLKVTGSRAAPCAADVADALCASVAVDGGVRGCVNTGGFFSQPFPFVTVTVRGKVSPDFCLGHITLLFAERQNS